jgi:hypothetical protein
MREIPFRATQMENSYYLISEAKPQMGDVNNGWLIEIFALLSPKTNTSYSALVKVI